LVEYVLTIVFADFLARLVAKRLEEEKVLAMTATVLQALR
jgi:hypothetical protein